MRVAEFDTDHFEVSKQSAEDRKLLVKFFLKPKQDRAASLQEGRPVFKDVEYIDIKIPGSRNTGICRPASPKDKTRFAEHYAAFKGRIEAPSEGTPLTEWPLITRSMCENLAFIHIKTVENLAGVNDAHISKMMGGMTMKQKAIDWLEVAEDEAPILKLKAELAERDERILKLEKQMEQLAKLLPAETAPVVAAAAAVAELPVKAPSVASDSEQATPEVDSRAITPRRRRKKKGIDDGAIQNDQPTR